MDTTGPPCLGHIAIAVGEPRRVAAFYRDLLDLQIVRDGGNQLTAHELVALYTRAKQRGLPGHDRPLLNDREEIDRLILGRQGGLP